MRKRLKSTIVEKAIESIPGFNAVYLKLQATGYPSETEQQYP
jgi:hypothetical protein